MKLKKILLGFLLVGLIVAPVLAGQLGGIATKAGTLEVSGKLNVDDTTDATTTTDGSLQTDGGLSVAKNTVMGGELTINNPSATNRLNISNTGQTAQIKLNNNGVNYIDAAGGATSQLTFRTGTGPTSALQITETQVVLAKGKLNVDDTTDATSTTDGSLQTDGGLSVAKKAVFGDTIKVAELADAAAGNSTLYYSTTQSKLVYKDSGGTVRDLW